MRVLTRHRATRRRRRPPQGLYWLLAVVGLAVLGWLFWRSGRPVVPVAKPPPKPVLTPPARPGRTSLPPARTNVVVAPPRPPLVVTATLPPVVVAPRTNPPLPPPGLVATAAPPAALVIPRVVPGPFAPRTVRDVLEAQITLARQGISSGSLDGVAGSQTRAALLAYQARKRLPLTGLLDAPTRAELRLEEPPLTTYTVSGEDVARLLPVSRTWLGKSQQARLDFETVLELVAEKTRSHPNLIRRLNPGLDWSDVAADTVLRVPNLPPATLASRAALVRIHLAAKSLEAFDDEANLLVHCPCSLARLVEKRPVGELHVVVVAHNPNYTFNPEVFPESAEARQLGRKLILPPGPNNPVGVAWIGLDRPGYGIHGTPYPEDVGRSESHGCFRLTNWDAATLAQLVSVGAKVLVEP